MRPVENCIKEKSLNKKIEEVGFSYDPLPCEHR